MMNSKGMNLRLQTILDIFDGTLTDSEAAMKHNVSETEIYEWKAFYTASVRQFVKQKKAAPDRAHGTKRIRIAAAAAACAVFVLGAIATAAPSVFVECEDNDTFFCFEPNTPAKSAEINHNFATTAQWVGGAIGPFDAPNLATEAGVTTIAGDLSVTGTSAVQNLSVNGESTFSDDVTAGTIGASTVNASTVKTTSLNIGGKPVYKTLAGTNIFSNGNCTSPSAPCTINISSAGFSAAPVCVLTNRSVDTTGYQENMLIASITTTTLNIWEGRYLTDGTTMDVLWICYGK